MPHVAHAVCPHDCPDSCLMDITVENGRAVKITANKEHPFTRGAEVEVIFAATLGVALAVSALAP